MINNKDIYQTDLDKDKDKDKRKDKNEKNGIEDEYNDFDDEFDDIDLGDANDKQKDKKINSSKPAFDIDIDIDNLNKKDDLLGDFKIGSDIYNKDKKNTKNNFDSYSGMNILDQIMGGSRRNNDFDLNNNFGGGGTFITGSLTGSKNNNYNIDKPPIFGDGNGSKNNEIKKDSKNEESKDNNNDDDFGDDFDNFEVEEI